MLVLLRCSGVQAFLLLSLRERIELGADKSEAQPRSAGLPLLRAANANIVCRSKLATTNPPARLSQKSE